MKNAELITTTNAFQVIAHTGPYNVPMLRIITPDQNYIDISASRYFDMVAAVEEKLSEVKRQIEAAK